MTKGIPFAILALLALGLNQAADAGTLDDRCAQLDPYGYPLYCDPVGPDHRNWWDQEVCCDEADCVEPSSTGCEQERTPYWCEIAELDSDGTLTCQFEVPAYCDLFECPSPPSGSPEFEFYGEGFGLCCYDVGCYTAYGDLCHGVLYWCDDGVCNDDGTVTCFDEDTP